MTFKKGDKRPANAGMKKGETFSERRFAKHIIEQALHRSIPSEIQEQLEEMRQAYEPLPDDTEAQKRGKKVAYLEKRIDTMLAIMPYCYPKLQAIQHSGLPEDGNARLQIEEFKLILKSVSEI